MRKNSSVPLPAAHNGHLRNTSEAFAPPNPNELLSAYSNFLSIGSVTNGNPHAGSSVLVPQVGGSQPSLNAMMHTIASAAPAAPSKCPMLAFVELTSTSAACPFAQALIAAASALSFKGVPVPWAFI